MTARTTKIALLASVFTLGFMGVASAEELSLDQAVARGIATNPEYGVVANNRRATDAELAQAKGLYLPSIDARAQAGAEWDDNGNVVSRTSGVKRSENYMSYNYNVTLTQMLFDGFAAQNEVERQEARVRSATSRVEETAQLVGLNIVEGYLDVMRQRDLLQIAKDNVAEHIAMSNEIRTTADAGRTTEADVQQAQARLAAARANEADARQALRNAEAQFVRYTGAKPDVLVMPSVPLNQLQGTVDEAVQTGLVSTPTLAVYAADTDVAWQEYEASKAPFYPRIDLQLSGTQSNDINANAGVDKNATAAVVAKWNLYRGGIDSNVKLENSYRHAQAKERRSQEARRVEEDIRNSWAAMVAAGERGKEFDAQATANEKVVSLYKDQFELDRRTLLDVLDAQNELFVARSNSVNAKYLEMLAVYRILGLQGKLLPALNVASPREAILANAE